MNLVQASYAINRNRAYLQQYITRGVPRELHESDRKALATLLNVDENILREPTNRTKRPLAFSKPLGHNLDTRRPMPDKGPRDLPIRGRALGTNGVIINLDQSPVDWVERPSSLMGAVEAFGVYVAGDSMHPALPNGALVYVNPAKPPRNGDFVVVEKANGEAIVKILKSHNHDSYILSQLNPPDDKIKLPKSEVVSIFKVVTVDYP